MPRRRRTFVACCAAASLLLLLLPPALAQEPQPYDFKGVILGVERSAFETMPFPDGAPPSGWDHFPSAVSCRADSAHTSVCAWGGDVQIPLRLGLGGRLSRSYGFYFVTDPADGQERLFRILVWADDSAASPAVASLRDKFGEPTEFEVREVQTGLGPREQATFLWRNAASSVFVESPSGSVGDMIIVYEHSRLAAAARALQQSVDRARTPNPM